MATAGDAETGQRGYLLTGDEKYLAPYSNALSDVRSRISVLQKAATEGFIAPQEVEKIDRQREFLDVTLASIGDGVIVTDAKGRVTFLNEVAQKLCGWSLPDAKGRSCIEIFNIVNETTRALVQNPVDGGTISAASGGHGTGSTFLVTRPKAFRPQKFSLTGIKLSISQRENENCG